MYSWENPDDRVSIVQMNSELRHAQLELLSAHCATHQLRLRFSLDDLARFGQRDVLRKSVQAANALSEYYSSIENRISGVQADSEPAVALTDERIREAIELVSSYLRDQRESYFHSARSSQQTAKGAYVALFLGGTPGSGAGCRVARSTGAQPALLSGGQGIRLCEPA